MASYPSIWLGMAALGIAAGFAIPKKAGARTGASGVHDEAPATARERKEAGSELRKADVSLGPLPVSKDSMDDLLALDATELYGRLGLWLLDASAEDMASFWKTYHDRGNADSWIKDLIFTQWAKKDLDGLMAAAERDMEEGAAWWAWTMSDPDAALAAMDGQSEYIRSFVLRGIANFHPKRGLKMLEEDPSIADSLDLSNLAASIGKDDPQAGLELLVKHNSHDLTKALRKWAKEDPHRALEWIIERGADANLRKQFAETVAEENPEALAELTAGMSSGSMKREFENTLSARLAETDPEKALEDARKIESPTLAAQRLAQVGKVMVDEQPERAFETLMEIFKTCPDAANRMKMTRYPNGGSGSAGGVPGVSELLGELTRWNPQMVMESVKGLEAGGASGASHNRDASWLAATAWLGKDQEGFSTWCEQQDEATFNFGASAATNFLADREDYAAAVAWAERIKDPQQQASSLIGSISRWASRDRDAALRWYEQAELPDGLRTQLKNYFPEPSQ